MAALGFLIETSDSGYFVDGKFHPWVSRSSRVDIKTIAALALSQAESLLRQWYPAGRLKGDEFEVGNLRGDPGKSLKINVRTGKWSDFSGEESGFDLVDLYAQKHGIEPLEAATELADALGYDGTHVAPAPPAKPQAVWAPMVPPPAGVGRPRLSGKVHAYHDAAGNPTHFIQRVEKGEGEKDFYPQTYGSLDGVLGWHPRAIKEQRPIYNLHHLAERPNAPVLVCEGEKACDAAALRLPSYVCTTWQGGTKTIKKADFSPLEGRNVVIWPDADGVGIEAAQEIRQILPQAVVLNVDGLPNGFDAADLGNLEDAEAWVRARLPSPGGSPAVRLPIYNAAEDDDSPVEPPQWIVHNWLPVGRVTLFYADGGVGKTTVSQQLLTACQSGRQWLGMCAKRCQTVAMLCEDEKKEIRYRQSKINALMGTSRHDLGATYWMAGIGEDNTLATFDCRWLPESA
jgi:AAA domain/Domain of unknown function (DUF6371)